MFPKNLGLRDLVTLEDWQKIQDLFSDVMGITLRTISLEGKPLSKTSQPTRLCSEILPKISQHSDFCGKFLLSKDVKDTINIREKTNFKCPSGLDVFVVPVKAVSDNIVAYMVVGPVILKSRKGKSEYAKDAEKLGVKLDDLMDALIEINVFTYNKIYSVTQLVQSTFSYMAQTGYHKKRLGKIAPEILEMDPLFSRYYEEKVLNALLNSCTLALDADSGSVMTLDKKTNKLHIKVAQKLDGDIVDNANMKVGEGIAGLAAATAQPIILPKDGDKNGRTEKMKRNYINSSMIIPFIKGDDLNVRGVINLNVIRKDKEFSDKDIALVKELTNLASIALMPLR